MKSSHKVEIYEEESLLILAETKRLYIRSISLEDEDDYVALFKDNNVTEKYFANGKTREEKTTKDAVQQWVEQWKQHNPFSIYSLFKKETREFLGLFGFTMCDRGKIDTSYAIHQQFWGKRYVSETAEIMFQSIIPRLMLKKYWVNHAPLKFIVGTARNDNIASQHILKKSGFREIKLLEWGRWCFYQLSAKQKCNDYHHFFRERDLKLQREKIDTIKNESVDITQEEMAASDFGQQSNTAKFRPS